MGVGVAVATAVAAGVVNGWAGGVRGVMLGVTAGGGGVVAVGTIGDASAGRPGFRFK